MILRWVVVVAAVGCGRAGFDERVPGDSPDDAHGGSDADGPPTTDAPTVGPCTGTTLLDDPLDDAVAGPSFSAQPATGVTLVEGAGHLDLQFAPTVGGGNYGYYRSLTAFPTEGLCATVEVSQVTGDVASTYFKLRTAQLEIELLTSGGTIHLRTRQSNNVSVERIIPLDLVASRYWRLRQVAGTTYWETSPDGLAFTTHVTRAGFFTAATCQLEIGAGTQATATGAGIGRFESVRVFGP